MPIPVSFDTCESERGRVCADGFPELFFLAFFVLKAQELGLAVTTSDSPAVMADFSRGRGITFPLLSDPGSRTIKVLRHPQHRGGSGHEQ